MRWKIKKCPKCNEYTLKDFCPTCKVKTRPPQPPRFSPKEDLSNYRIEYKLKYKVCRIRDLEGIKI
ncbi:ribosome biogenesis protein [archaeon]|nr:MAG: ribosome biogenesis protein [archaeon]